MDHKTTLVCMKCKSLATNYCSRCLQACYCSAACQRVHWPVHKSECAAITIKETRRSFINYMHQRIAGSINIMAAHNGRGVIFVEINECIMNLVGSKESSIHFAHLRFVSDKDVATVALEYKFELPADTCSKVIYILTDFSTAIDITNSAITGAITNTTTNTNTAITNRTTAANANTTNTNRTTTTNANTTNTNRTTTANATNANTTNTNRKNTSSSSTNTTNAHVNPGTEWSIIFDM